MRGLIFSLVFAIGTLIAVFGWISEMNAKPKIKYVAIAGHLIQVIGVFGAMMVSDDVGLDEIAGDEEDRFKID